jgi:hypothetical protein
MLLHITSSAEVKKRKATTVLRVYMEGNVKHQASSVTI